MILHHPKLIKLLQQAYSAEKAAAFAYQGHAGSVKRKAEKDAIRVIEMDEWEHRREVYAIMQTYGVPVSRLQEIRFHLIGKMISWSCYVIGRFMPFYFAGRLESGNVCEYFRMKEYFNSLGIHRHDQVLYDMGLREKEHEVYFAEKVKDSPYLGFFEKVFSWSFNHSFNNIDLEHRLPLNESDSYCKP